MRVLVVGGGCTGSSTALRLREKLGASAKIEIWEKARGAGGRYTTSRDSHPDGMKADMGAQYASVDPKDGSSRELMEALVAKGAAEPAPEALLEETAERAPGTVQFRGTNGQNGIVKAMIEMSGAEVHFEKRVMKIDQRGGAWAVAPRDGAQQTFDCVVLCVPGCGPGGDNLNKIHGNWERLLSDSQWRDTEVPHDCRFSLALWLEPGHQAAVSAFFGGRLEKRARGELDLLAWQSKKDGLPADGPQVVVVHTGPGARGNKHQAEPRMLTEACRLLGVPPRAVTTKKLITWYQSQVLSTSSKEPCLVVNQSPPMILAGDYLTGSTFTACVRSATAAAEAAAKLLSGGPSARPLPTTPPSNGTVQKGGKGGDDERPCSYCRKRAKCQRDKTDGNWYCDSCWKSYYG